MAKAFFKEIYKRYMCEKCGLRPVYTSRAEPLRADRLCRTCYIAESVEHNAKWLSNLSYDDRRAFIEKRNKYKKEYQELHYDNHKIIALLSYHKNMQKNREKKSARNREYYKKKKNSYTPKSG